MDARQILTSSYLDIIFNGRNKEYGVYQLRTGYPSRLIRSALLVLLSALLAMSLKLYLFSGMPENRQVRNPAGVPVRIAPPPLLPEPAAPRVEIPPPRAPRAAALSVTPPVIMKDEEVPDNLRPPLQEEISRNRISAVAGEGMPGGSDEALTGPAGSGFSETSFPVAAETVADFVEQMPEFTAGSLSGYLSEHIRYPEQARETGIQGRVVLRFIVNEDGSVSDVHVQRSIGGGCDEEAVRVVKGMPRWRPGKMNGKAVRVFFTLPVYFRLS